MICCCFRFCCRTYHWFKTQTAELSLDPWLMTQVPWLMCLESNPIVIAIVTCVSRLMTRDPWLLTHAWPMVWLRLVGSLKLQVSFAEYSLFYRALLRKRPTILRSLRIVATPYDSWVMSQESCVMSVRSHAHSCKTLKAYAQSSVPANTHHSHTQKQIQLCVILNYESY